jgi:hypothetical protein
MKDGRSGSRSAATRQAFSDWEPDDRAAKQSSGVIYCPASLDVVREGHSLGAVDATALCNDPSSRCPRILSSVTR